MPYMTPVTSKQTVNVNVNANMNVYYKVALKERG